MVRITADAASTNQKKTTRQDKMNVDAKDAERFGLNYFFGSSK